MENKEERDTLAESTGATAALRTDPRRLEGRRLQPLKW
jgi:hypothetical protein